MWFLCRCCAKNIETLCSHPKLYAINLGQPHYNDMEKIFQNSVDKGIKIFGYHAEIKDRPTGFNHSLHSQIKQVIKKA